MQIGKWITATDQRVNANTGFNTRIRICRPRQCAALTLPWHAICIWCNVRAPASERASANYTTLPEWMTNTPGTLLPDARVRRAPVFQREGLDDLFAVLACFMRLPDQFSRSLPTPSSLLPIGVASFQSLFNFRPPRIAGRDRRVSFFFFSPSRSQSSRASLQTTLFKCQSVFLCVCPRSLENFHICNLCNAYTSSHMCVRSTMSRFLSRSFLSFFLDFPISFNIAHKKYVYKRILLPTHVMNTLFRFFYFSVNLTSHIARTYRSTRHSPPLSSFYPWCIFRFYPAPLFLFTNSLCLNINVTFRFPPFAFNYT